MSWLWILLGIYALISVVNMHEVLIERRIMKYLELDKKDEFVSVTFFALCPILNVMFFGIVVFSKDASDVKDLTRRGNHVIECQDCGAYSRKYENFVQIIKESRASSLANNVETEKCCKCQSLNVFIREDLADYKIPYSPKITYFQTRKKILLLQKEKSMRDVEKKTKIQKEIIEKQNKAMLNLSIEKVEG